MSIYRARLRNTSNIDVIRMMLVHCGQCQFQFYVMGLYSYDAAVLKKD